MLIAALIGRPIGILVSVALHGGRPVHLPADLRWRELIVVSLAASAGFTFALFFATAIMPAGPLLGELKLGALSTAAGALVALAARGSSASVASQPRRRAMTRRLALPYT